VLKEPPFGVSRAHTALDDEEVTHYNSQLFKHAKKEKLERKRRVVSEIKAT
jgi:hypothetical protein